jgi:hypothetical protein
MTAGRVQNDGGDSFKNDRGAGADYGRLTAKRAQGKPCFISPPFSQGVAPHPTKGSKTLWDPMSESLRRQGEREKKARFCYLVVWALHFNIFLFKMQNWVLTTQEEHDIIMR